MAVMAFFCLDFGSPTAWTGLAASLDLERKSLQHDGKWTIAAGAVGLGLGQASYAEIV
jgi:hypothetical protein